MIVNDFLDLWVGKYNGKTGKIELLYELIPKYEYAHLLTQKEMPHVNEYEQIVIIPRWCFNVGELKEKQNELARKYSVMV